MDYDYIKGTELWIKNIKSSIQQDRLDKVCLEGQINLMSEQLETTKEMIEHNEAWLERVKKELEDYKETFNIILNG